MALTQSQQDALRAGLLAETDPTIAQLVIDRTNDDTVKQWCNSAHPTQKAWKAEATKRDLFEAINVTKFDAVSAGKRDAWRLMTENVPIDFGRNAMRNAVDDVWGSADSPAVLTALTESATRGQVYIGGTTKTTRGISAMDRVYAGQFTVDDISYALADARVSRIR